MGSWVRSDAWDPDNCSSNITFPGTFYENEPESELPVNARGAFDNNWPVQGGQCNLSILCNDRVLHQQSAGTDAFFCNEDFADYFFPRPVFSSNGGDELAIDLSFTLEELAVDLQTVEQHCWALEASRRGAPGLPPPSQEAWLLEVEKPVEVRW